MLLVHCLGEIAWLAVPPKRKRLAIGQILFCNITDDPKEARRIAKASTTRFGRMIIDVLRYPEIKDGAYKDMVEFINKEYLDDALENGRGAIFGGCSQWQLGTPWGGSCFGRVSVDFCGHETEW